MGACEHIRKVVQGLDMRVEEIDIVDCWRQCEGMGITSLPTLLNKSDGKFMSGKVLKEWLLERAQPKSVEEDTDESCPYCMLDEDEKDMDLSKFADNSSLESRMAALQGGP